MTRGTPRYPFEAKPAQVAAGVNGYVDSVFESLVSEFLVLPKGPGFVEYETFERGYETLKRGTSGFRNLTAKPVLSAIKQDPVALVVLRTILGFTPPEWAYLAAQHTGVPVPQGFARTLDRKVRLSPGKPFQPRGATRTRLEAMIGVACQMLQHGAATVEPGRIHRLDKADTRNGLTGIRNAAGLGIPFAMLLYERFLGRPFAGHRDSVSEIIGDALESAVENELAKHGVGFRKTKRAERLQGFDQTPDFLIPDEFAPRVIIEAKLTEDDGTARDKVTRIQHLCEQSAQGMSKGRRRYEVIACIGGRGFGVRREDMKKLLLATQGKVFTPKTLDRMVRSTTLTAYDTNRP